MTRATVSVITPCYRQAHFLPACIECVRGQSYAPIEHVIVNDGSDDDTEAVAASYGDQVHYVGKPNGGLASARNAGLKAAEGRFVLFLDADDLLDPDALAWLVEAVEQREDRLGIMGLCYFQDDPYAGRLLEYLPRQNMTAMLPDSFQCDPLLEGQPDGLPPDHLSLLPYLFYTCFGPPHCHLCPKALVEEAGGFEEHLRFIGCEDWDLWMRLALRGAGVATVPRVGAFYRRYEGSMSTDTAKMLQGRTEVLLRAHAVLTTSTDLRARWAKDLGRACRRVRRRYYALGLRSPLLASLSRVIRELEGGSVFGPTADRLALAYYRRFRPDVYRYYQGSYE